MRKKCVRLAATLCACVWLTDWVDAGEQGQALFNGKDLTGWVNVNAAPDTWSVRDGIIVCNGQPKGFLRSTRTYENYILEYEWKHLTEGGNAGVMIHADALPHIGSFYPRSVEIQAKDGDHGSVFGIQGCLIKPLTNPLKRGWLRARATEERAKPAGQWNHYCLTSRDGNLELAVNGKVVTRAADSSLVKGYICLESEGAEVHFRNLRITELPSSNPPPEKVAAADEGFTSLFDGLTFRGWKYHEGLEGRWEIVSNLINLREEQPPRKRGQDWNLWTEKSYRDFVLIADWRLMRKPIRQPMNAFTEDGLIKRDENNKVVKHEILHSGDSGIYLRGEMRAQVNIWSQPMGSGDINSYHKDAKIPVEIRRACMPKLNADNPPRKWNRFIITMRGDRVTVVLNGQTVIDEAELPGVPESGPIALQNHRDPIQFRNLFLKPLL